MIKRTVTWQLQLHLGGPGMELTSHDLISLDGLLSEGATKVAEKL